MRDIPTGTEGVATRSPMRWAAVLLALGALLWAGCASTGAGSAPPATTPVAHSAPTTTPTATATAVTCATLTPGPADGWPSFPLPPNTISGFPNGNAGAGYIIACTPGATQASITTFFNTALPQAGWQRWNPQTQDAHGCGTEPNDFWQWYKNDASGGGAVGWSFTGPPLPDWMLVVCSLAYGK